MGEDDPTIETSLFSSLRDFFGDNFRPVSYHEKNGTLQVIDLVIQIPDDDAVYLLSVATLSHYLEAATVMSEGGKEEAMDTAIMVINDSELLPSELYKIMEMDSENIKPFLVKQDDY